MIKILAHVRAILLMPFIIIWTAGCSLIVISMQIISLPKRRFADRMSKFWADVLLFFSGVKLHVHGLEHLPQGGFLYIFNHTSHYDIPVMFSASPMFPHFGAKSELYSVPIFGQTMKVMGALPIERKNREKVMQIYKEAEARVAKGDVFALAPEGTRQPGGGQLGAFKSGPFFFSVNAHMPIVPVVIVNCEKIIPKHSLLVNKNKLIQDVHVYFLEPIMPDKYSEETIADFKTFAREKMQATLNNYQ